MLRLVDGIVKDHLVVGSYQRLELLELNLVVRHEIYVCRHYQKTV